MLTLLLPLFTTPANKLPYITGEKEALIGAVPVEKGDSESWVSVPLDAIEYTDTEPLVVLATATNTLPSMTGE